ncbi:hypothetical protein MJO28_000365 [Puccinia striiformis f. sp. tritici]|uniref:Uncharacterized protein n=4 Tax=Puccinia striiformis TaxID=27350 RepID=A0A0L0VY98_9BASI|nr:hypothetical protein Pst134EA_000870 [Puccinia striiformis f. sp. tritici]KAI9600915.1 hypothetical protein H4Q26_000709 [Puccinia striiformis f. sp. tritici PST-130]KNF04248.1 hypothetical protein PSTG_02595 [Puccinia striiformis f. sp. tritici PST-78]POW01536.1 hypothetical protein PSTT_12437 [Puccinia striiformis]KAH9467057.1 hypothetical protein Pst134EB_002087 [Puccinia striiformis f. sp. tritici]KAH9473805.1 hypothetical protein Pst134EA_000870 [Puccinia striiformis f. sp. tritici]
MSCCASNRALARRAIPSPTPIAARPAASATPTSPSDAGPIVLFPGENPADLRGAPFTTLPPSAVATPGPSVPSRPAASAVPPSPVPSSFAGIATPHLPQPTASGSALPSPLPSQTPDSSEPHSSSTTTIAVVVSIIGVIVIGVIGYAVYRFHLRKKQGGKDQSMKLRPLITASSISRPILANPDKPLLPISHPSSRRSRDSIGNRLNYKGAPTLPPILEKAPEATGRRAQRDDPRKTRDFYNYATTDILDSYGSETSYPSTYAGEVDFEYPVFRPSPAQVPRIHNVRDAYPTTPTETDEMKLRSSMSASNYSNLNQPARRLQNLPFKIPKPNLSQSTKPLRRS